MNDKEIIEGLEEVSAILLALIETGAAGKKIAADCERLFPLSQAALSRLQSLQWRPIEEAPKDGTPLLARDGDQYFEAHFVEWFDTEKTVPTWGSRCNQYVTDTVDFTHFIPLSAFNQEEE